MMADLGVHPVLEEDEEGTYSEYFSEYAWTISDGYTPRLMQAIADIGRAHYHQYFPSLEGSSRFKQKAQEKLIDTKNMFVNTLDDFQRSFDRYGIDDSWCKQFISLIRSVLEKAGDNLYEVNEIDSNMMYIVAILGLLHCDHIPDDVNIRQILRSCLKKYESELRDTATLTSLHDNNQLGKQSSERLDTLYLYILYVFYNEQKLPYCYLYWSDWNLHYRSGVVYHLLQSGCGFTDCCLDIILSFDKGLDKGHNEKDRQSEQAVDLIKDFIFTCGDLDRSSRRCRLTQYIMTHCYKKPTLEDDWWTVYHSEAIMVGDKEDFFFWEVAELDIFCQHQKCLDLMLVEERYGVCKLFKSVVTAMMSTPKSLKQICRLAIRRCFRPTQVVQSCQSQSQIPPKLRNYLAFDSFRAPIRPFYKMAEMRQQKRRGDREIPFEEKKALVIKVLKTYNLEEMEI